MTFTLATLTYRVARELGVAIEGTATGGSTSTLLDSVARTEADDYWNGGTAWLLYDAGGAAAAPQGEYAVITDYAISGGTVTTQWTTAPAAGDRYAVAKKRYKLASLIQAVNRALQDLGTIPVVDSTTITTADDQTEYTLPVAANTDLRQVWLQTNDDDANDNRWFLLSDWKLQHAVAGTGHTIIFPVQYSSGYAVKLVYMAPHPDLNIATDKLYETIHENVIIYSAASKALEVQIARGIVSDEISNTLVYMQQKAMEAKRAHPLMIPRRTTRYLIVDSKSGRYVDDETPGTVHL
jgi:hypothetical protein